MKKPVLKYCLLGVALLGLWFTYLAMRARSNLVTLNVRNMDVRKVAGKIWWQTWETILVQKEVNGTVTLNVRKMPLESVLEIIATQTSSRWTAVYPLYTTSRTLKQLKRVVRGELAVEDSPWSAWKGRPMFGRFMFADNARRQNRLVTLKLEDKDVQFASYALARFARAQVVPEDGTTGSVQLSLEQAPMAEAVHELARQAGRKWTVFYVLQGGFFPGRRPAMARENRGTNPPVAAARSEDPAATNTLAARAPQLTGAETNLDRRRRGRGPGDGPPGFGRRELTPEEQAERQKQFEAQLAAMSPEERERAQQMRQRFEELRQLPPEQRRQRMGELFNNPDMRQRMQERMVNRMMNGIQNSTPERRMEFYERISERRERLRANQDQNR